MGSFLLVLFLWNFTPLFGSFRLVEPVLSYSIPHLFAAFSPMSFFLLLRPFVFF